MPAAGSSIGTAIVSPMTRLRVSPSAYGRDSVPARKPSPSAPMVLWRAWRGAAYALASPNWLSTLSSFLASPDAAARASRRRRTAGNTSLSLAQLAVGDGASSASSSPARPRHSGRWQPDRAEVRSCWGSTDRTSSGGQPGSPGAKGVAFICPGCLVLCVGLAAVFRGQRRHAMSCGGCALGSLRLLRPIWAVRQMTRAG